MAHPPFILKQGTAPLLVSMPHIGTHVPEALAARLTDEGRRVPDTDWHLPLLYDFAESLGASILMATHSRYVIDLNRPSDNANLYPGQDTTGLCPVDTFDKTPLYQNGISPDDAEIGARRDSVWTPYHHALQQELARLRTLHPSVALWDAHSIRSELPRFFEGRLPDFNLGTANGTSCDPALADAVLAIAQAAMPFTAVLNGRFKGGYITRQYGKPSDGVHAIQLELSQRVYMNETHPFAYREDLAAQVKPHLKAMLAAVLAHVGAARQA